MGSQFAHRENFSMVFFLSRCHIFSLPFGYLWISNGVKLCESFFIAIECKNYSQFMGFYGTNCSKSLIFFQLSILRKLYFFHFWILARKLEDIFTLKLDPQNMINSKIQNSSIKKFEKFCQIGSKSKIHHFTFVWIFGQKNEDLEQWDMA